MIGGGHRPSLRPQMSAGYSYLEAAAYESHPLFFPVFVAHLCLFAIYCSQYVVFHVEDTEGTLNWECKRSI